MISGWHMLLDSAGSGRVSFVPFCSAARSMGFSHISMLLVTVLDVPSLSKFHCVSMSFLFFDVFLSMNRCLFSCKAVEAVGY